MQKCYNNIFFIVSILVTILGVSCAVDDPYLDSQNSSSSTDSGGQNDTDHKNRQPCPEEKDPSEASYQGSGFHFNSICEPSPPREPTDQACLIVFRQLELQLQISAEGTVIVDSSSTPVGFHPISDIPIIFDKGGKTIHLIGNDLPHFIPYLGNPPPSVLEMYAKPNSEASGSFDPETGELSITGVSLLADVFLYNSGQPDGKGLPLGTITQMPPANFSTAENQTATGNGNPEQIIVSGQAYDPATQELAVATVLTIPKITGAEPIVDASIGGGALAAVIRGELSEDPETCQP